MPTSEGWWWMWNCGAWIPIRVQDRDGVLVWWHGETWMGPVTNATGWGPKSVEPPAP